MGWMERAKNMRRSAARTAAWLIPTTLAAMLAVSPGMAQTNPNPPTTPKATQAAKPGAGGTAQQSATVPGQRQINLNSASESELDGLPGIGKARADAIVKNRPYKSPDDLVSKHVISQKVFDGLRDRVVAR